MDINVQDAFAEAMKRQLPGLKTKAQVTAFMASFEAYREVVNVLLGSSGGDEIQAMGVLHTSFDLIRKATEIGNKLRDVPEAASSNASADFREEGVPTNYEEYDKQRKLLSELEGLKTMESLSLWWTTNRKRIDEVTTATLRNPLLDAIREKKDSLKPIAPAP